MDRDELLGSWQSTATEEGMLPSGTEVQVERDLTAAGMVQRGIMPAELRALALQFSSNDGVVVSALEEEELARFRRMELLYITQLVRAFKTPGMDAYQPFRLTVEDLEADPPRIPVVDLEALQDIVRRRRTLRGVDALSRLARGLVTPEEAGQITNEEFAKTILAWRSFRDQLRGAQRRPDGEDVEQPAVKPADHLGPGGRPRRRRSPRAKAGQPEAHAEGSAA